MDEVAGGNGEKIEKNGESILKMRIVFMATPAFAVPSLLSLIKNEEVLGIVTQPDRPKGRGGKKSFSPVKEIGVEYNLPVYQPEKVNDADFVDYLKRLNLDIIVVVAFGQILSPVILGLPKYGCINVHASLLPKYRGAAPINWAIIKGEVKTGITTFYINEKMDRGDIILQEEMGILPCDTALLLSNKLAILGAETLMKTLALIEKGKALRISQNEREVSYAPCLKKEDGLINWKRKAGEIHNLVRGMLPWPGAFTYVNTSIDSSKLEVHRLKIWETEIFSTFITNVQSPTPGEIVDILKHKGFLVATGEGYLLIKEVQIENKRKMSSDDYIHGHKMKVGMRLGEIK